MATKRTVARGVLSPVVPATTVAGSAHADRTNRGQNSALTSRAHQHRSWVSPRRPIEQRPERRPLLTWTPKHWLSKPTPTEVTEVRAAPSLFVFATTVAV